MVLGHFGLEQFSQVRDENFCHRHLGHGRFGQPAGMCEECEEQNFFTHSEKNTIFTEALDVQTRITKVIVLPFKIICIFLCFSR